MKKYTKPVVEIVSLKSSENIAKTTTFKDLQGQFIKEELYKDKYAISSYAITNSTFREEV